MSHAQPPGDDPTNPYRPPAGGGAPIPPPPPGPPPSRFGYPAPPPPQPPQQPQSPYPPAPPAYGQPAPLPYGYGAPAPSTSGRAIAVMVLGIAGLVLTCAWGIGVIAAIVGLSLAPGAKREIRSSNGWKTGDGMVTAGVICAWIAVGLVILGIVIIVIIGVTGGFDGSSYYRRY